MFAPTNQPGYYPQTRDSLTNNTRHYHSRS
jgi:hypothetical protein